MFLESEEGGEPISFIPSEGYMTHTETSLTGSLSTIPYLLCSALVPITPCISAELFTWTNEAIYRVFTQWLVTNYTPVNTAIILEKQHFSTLSFPVGRCLRALCRERFGSSPGSDVQLSNIGTAYIIWDSPPDFVVQAWARGLKGNKRREKKGDHDSNGSYWNCW